MKKFNTVITAIDPKTKTIKVWPGPSVFASTFEDAKRRLEESGQGFCTPVYEVLFEDEQYFQSEVTSLDSLSLRTFTMQEQVEC